MRVWGFSRSVVGIYVAAALLAGCGGSQPPISAASVTPQSRTIAARSDRSGSWMPPETRKAATWGYKASGPLLYVANSSTNSGFGKVTVYPAKANNPRPIATITNGLNSPAADCLDSHGRLYVTNQPISSGGWISEYPLGKVDASMLIKDGLNTPAFCAIDSEGNLWVTNIGGPNATEYIYGSKKPHMVITKGMGYPVGIAIDHSGNLYVANRLRSSNVVVYARGSKTPSRTISDGVTSPVGLAIDAEGILYVTNIAERNVEEYLPGGDHPFKTITEGVPTPAGVTVNKKGWLYVANGSGIYHRVVEFPPGSITPSKRHVSKSLHPGSEGVAYFPPVLP